LSLIGAAAAWRLRGLAAYAELHAGDRRPIEPRREGPCLPRFGASSATLRRRGREHVRLPTVYLFSEFQLPHSALA